MIDEHIANIINLTKKLDQRNLPLVKRFQIANEIKQEAIDLHLELFGPDIELPPLR